METVGFMLIAIVKLIYPGAYSKKGREDQIPRFLLNIF